MVFDKRGSAIEKSLGSIIDKGCTSVEHNISKLRGEKRFIMSKYGVCGAAALTSRSMKNQV